MEYGKTYKVTFVDDGQDFIDWYIKDRVVIDCQPFQGRIWVGKVVTNSDFETIGKGDSLILEGLGHLKHAIESVEEITDKKELKELMAIYKGWKDINQKK